MAKASISVCKGRGSMAHNNRDFITENVDQSRTKDNITYKKETLEQAYEKCFGQAIAEYNERQKRADRKIDGIDGYMAQIRNSKNGEKLFYENVVQVGNMFDSHVGTEQGEVCKQILDEYMRGFQERNPNLYVFNAVLHLDEQTPHLHIDYIPLAHGYKQGLQVRNSLDRAFKEQGLEGKANKYENRTIAWQNTEKDHIEGIMIAHGLERAEDRGLDQEHLTVDQYKAVAERIHNEVKQIDKQIESKPTLFSKKTIKVKVEDLEQLEHRAKLSLVHEKATKELVKEVKKDVKETHQYNLDHMSRALMYQRDAEDSFDKAEQERKKAVEVREKYEKLYSNQQSLNDSYKQLYKVYESQKQTIADLQTENRSLRGQIADLRQSIEQRVQQAVEPFKKQIEGLSKKIDDMSKGQLTLMRAMRYVRDKFSGEVGSAVLNATLKTGNRFFSEDGFDEYSQDRESRLSMSVSKELRLEIEFRKGEEGLGVYTPKGTCLANCDTFKEAKEMFPSCDIRNLNRDRGLTR